MYIVSTDSGLANIEFGRVKTEQEYVSAFRKQFDITRNDDVFKTLRAKLDQYFQGRSVNFDEPVDLLRGTLFQRKIWDLVRQIPYGQTRTYGQIAEQINKPGAARAVGAANGANPLPIIIPCHRVVQTNGNLGGYGGGLDIKDALLRLERVVL
ncbi:methylated-DNA--[protein]-cysteine S-methyltransferase [candidate division KSB1 bacterium]|nr:methylated-DNA--[protein]-cysteine S-methyltransferase [candidate division KSB1 bacterium]